MSIIVGVPAQLQELNQKGLLERAFHDGLFPHLSFRMEALHEEWPANTGTEIYMTRPGLLAPVVKPIQPGTDPTPQVIPYEQWVATLQQYTGTIDTHVPTSVTAQANLFLRNIHQLGLQAGQSVNRVARNALFKAYLSGRTNLIAATSTTDTSIRVAALNGFTHVVIPSGNVRPQPVSPAYPLPIRVKAGSTVVARNVIGYVPDDPNDMYGPGTLLLDAAIGTAFANRSAVLSAYAPRVVRSAAGDSVDAIGANDTLTLQQCINAVAFLRNANVQPHDDGFYHAHISPLANAQIFADPVFQRLNQSLPEHMVYKQGFIGELAGIAFFMNSEAPGPTNTGTLIQTGSGSTPAQYGGEIGAEVLNNTGISIGRVVITGKGALYEKSLDESQFVTEAGITGKIGEFSVVNAGIAIQTERIRLTLRAPMDRLQQLTSATWSCSTSFPTPSDITAPSGPESHKRAIVLEHALSG